MFFLAWFSVLGQLVATGLALFFLRRTGKGLGWTFWAISLGFIALHNLLVFGPGLVDPSARKPPTWDVLIASGLALFSLLAVGLVGRGLGRWVKQWTRFEEGEREANEERVRLAELLSRLPVGVAVELEDKLAYVNTSFCQLVGAEDWVCRQHSLQDFLVPEDRQTLQQLEATSSSETLRVEVRFQRAHGSPRWVALRRHRGLWQGRLAIFWVCADMSEQKEREAQETATEALFAQGPVVLIRWRPAPARNVILVSENIAQWGFDRRQLLADPDSFYKWAHPEDRERVQREAQGFFASGAESWSQSYRLLCPDGRVRWIFDRTVVVRNAHGEVVAFDGYLLDVTEAWQAQVALERERARSAAALEATGEVVYDWNIQTGEINWNRNVERAFGLTPEEMGGIDRWEERIHPEDRQRVLKLLHQAVYEGVPFETEYRFRRANGSYAHVLDRGKVERTPEGVPVRMVGAMADLSAQKQLEEQLRLAQRLEALGQLAGGIAHDFNNILTAIFASVDFLQGKLPADSSAAGDVRVIREAAQRAAALTRQLLAFARRQVMEPQDLDLNAYLSHSLEMVRRVLPENIALDFIPGQRLGTVYADPGQLDQVILNLVVNARDAMPAGGILTVETENVLINGDYVREHPWAKEGRYVLLSISDTGVGMDRATLDRALEPFFTTKEPGKGTGLGLSTVYGIVKQHGGLLHLYSEPGKGTTVKVYLPIVQRRAVDVGGKLAGPLVGGTETILVVEDEEAVRRVLAEALAGFGYRVLTAANGVEALAVAERHGFAVDLVLTDVVMPHMGGWELYEKIAARAPGVRFLFSTGYSENAVHQNFQKKPGIHLITKPYGLEALARKVREVLDLRRDAETSPGL
ncbi:MAG: PAS domain-containing protein [Thermoanaerobaculum sp.]|nr:PAS domain-containing protein [Thermoanaerobaculum sp.]